MKIRNNAALVALCAGLLACSPVEAGGASSGAVQPSSQTATHPVSRLPVVPLTVSGPRGRHVFRVEVARTSAEQAQGLMFRTSMTDSEGMVFPMNPPRDASFWMKNTVIPLDLIFVGPDRRILNIAASAVPYSLDPIPSAGPVAAVLEINGGLAARLGIAPGDRVEW